MACGLCSSSRQTEFCAEVNIHVPGMQGLDVPGVWAFPKLTVCFNCGSTMLALSEEELHLLQEQAALVRAA
jgi:hypothetical protein